MSSNSQVFHAIGQGDIYVDVPNGAAYSKVLLQNALHVPDMAFTVVSLGRVMKAGYLVEFDNPSCNIKRKSNGVTGSREWVWERPLDQGKLGTGHYVILLMRLDPCHAAVP